MPVPAGASTDGKVLGPDQKEPKPGLFRRSSKDGLRSDRGGHGEPGCLTSRESRRQIFFGSLHSRRASARHRVSTNRPRPRRRGARPGSLESAQAQSIRSGSGLNRQASSTQPSKENPTDGSSHRPGRPEVPRTEGIRGVPRNLAGRHLVPQGKLATAGTHRRCSPEQIRKRKRWTKNVHTRECVARRAHAPQEYSGSQERTREVPRRSFRVPPTE